MIIGFVSEKGGVGKTTTALMLAGALSRVGKTVELLDCDEAQNAVAWAQRARRLGTLPFVVEEVTDEQSLQGRLGSVAGSSVVIVDLPGHRNNLLKHLGGHADLLISPLAPCGQEINQLYKLTYLLTMISTARATAGRGPLRFVALLNNLSSYRLKGVAELTDSLKGKIKVMHTVIPMLPSVELGLTEGLLPLGAKYRRANKIYSELAQEVIKLARSK